MAIGARSQSCRFPFSLGVLPSTPGIGLSYARPSSPSRSGGGLGLHLPAASTLDYAHKLTSTTLLIGGVIAFLLFARGRPRAAVRGLLRKHVAEVR
jgi:hypothetical protein